MQMPITSRI